MTTTARDMIELLRRHYLPEGRPAAGIFAPEIQAPDSGRRADLIFQGCTAAAGRELVGHEVKVSRADVLAELDDLTKSDPWQKYCDRWWLVIPDAALVEGLSLPHTWGVLLPPSGRRTRTMTPLVPAPKLNPTDQATAMRTLATWLHWKLAAAQGEAAAREREVRQLRDANDSLRERLPTHDSPAKAARERVVGEIVRKLGGVEHGNRVGDWDANVHVDDVVAALRDLGSVYARARDIGYRVDSTVEGLNRALAGVDRKLIADLAGAVQRFETSSEAAS